MRKKLPCNASQKDFIENYIHFSYPKCGRVVTGSEIDKFGEESKKYCTRKFYQWVTHM